MRVSLRRESGAKFIASNEAGNSIVLEGPEDVGGLGNAMRPMQTVLAGLAGCAAVDVLLILEKGRFRVDGLAIDVDAERADAVPAVFTKIHLVFRAAGSFDAARLERAVTLSMEKYCSVAKMLAPTVEITHSAELLPTG